MLSADVLTAVHRRLLEGASPSEVATSLKEHGVLKLGERARLLRQLSDPSWTADRATDGAVGSWVRAALEPLGITVSDEHTRRLEESALLGKYPAVLIALKDGGVGPLGLRHRAATALVAAAAKVREDSVLTAGEAGDDDAARARPETACATGEAVLATEHAHHRDEGHRLMSEGAFALAAEAYARARKAAAGQADVEGAAAANLSLALLRAGRAEEALAAAERAAALRPEWQKAHYRCGEALFALQRYTDATPRYATAKRLSPDDREVARAHAMAAEAAAGGVWLRQLRPGRDIAVLSRARTAEEGHLFRAAAEAGVLCYLVGDLHSRECVAVDVAWDVRGAVELARRHRMRVSGAIACCGRPDHVGGDVRGHRLPKGTVVPGMRELIVDHGVRARAHPAELSRVAVQCGLVAPRETADARGGGGGRGSGRLDPIGDEEVLRLGDTCELTALHTPGQTAGALCVLVRERRGGEGAVGTRTVALLSGASLLVGGQIGQIGAFGAGGADADAMYASLRRLGALALPREAVVLPSLVTGSSEGRTTIGALKADGLLANAIAMPLARWRQLLPGGGGGGDGECDGPAAPHEAASRDGGSPAPLPPSSPSPSVPRRRVVPYAPPRYAYGAANDGERLRRALAEEGYVICRGAASAAELTELRDGLWAWLEAHSTMRRDRVDTWDDYPGEPSHGQLIWGGIGQSDVQWKARTLPGVVAAFEAAWGLAAGAPLLTSFDGASAFRPPQHARDWRTEGALRWLHVDQNHDKVGLCALQGALLLYPQDSASGGLVVLPRSHLRHRALTATAGQRQDFVPVLADDARLEGLGDARLICADAGDLVLWDSRTVHASEGADPDAPLPRDERGAPRLARAASYVCMVPAAAHLASDPKLGERRAHSVEHHITTTHWPQDNRLTSEGRGPPDPARLLRLGRVARALVYGEAR